VNWVFPLSARGSGINPAETACRFLPGKFLPGKIPGNFFSAATGQEGIFWYAANKKNDINGKKVILNAPVLQSESIGTGRRGHPS
jgi:hypothetical protein